MNVVENDRGEWVTAVGAPGSLARAQVEWPDLIEKIRTLRIERIAVLAIRKAGVCSHLETRSLLTAAGF